MRYVAQLQCFSLDTALHQMHGFSLVSAMLWFRQPLAPHHAAYVLPPHPLLLLLARAAPRAPGRSLLSLLQAGAGGAAQLAAERVGAQGRGASRACEARAG